METGLEAAVGAVLAGFDARDDVFNTIEVSACINSLVAERRDAGEQIPSCVAAEQKVFQWMPMVQSCPEPEGVTPAMISQWHARATTCLHPLLQAHYAGAAWELSDAVTGRRCHHEVPTVLVDAAVAAEARDLFPDEIIGIGILRRALEAAQSYKQGAGVVRVRDAMLRFEDRVARPHLPGTWGFCFDSMLTDAKHSKQACLEQAHETQIISRLEFHHARLTQLAASAAVGVHVTLAAALRLASYYRRTSRPAEVRRVLSATADAYSAQAFQFGHPAAASWLEQVHRVLDDFELWDVADGLQPALREANRRRVENMVSHRITVTLDDRQAEELEQHLKDMTEGDWTDVFTRFAACFIVHREHATRGLNASRAAHPLLTMLVSTHVVAGDGRTVAVDASEEGPAMHHAGQLMSYGAQHLHWVVSRLVRDRQLGVQESLTFLAASPAVDADRRPILAAALEAYFRADWLTFAHLVVPQIEHIIRHLIEITDGSTLRQRGEDVHVRTLDDLLRSEDCERILTKSVAFYLRAVLTHSCGWNTRNNVCHGLLTPEEFGPRMADRLYHTLMLFGILRAKPRPAASDTQTI